MSIHRKLVRDRIPEIIKASGKKLTIEILAAAGADRGSDSIGTHFG